MEVDELNAHLKVNMHTWSPPRDQFQLIFLKAFCCNVFGFGAAVTELFNGSQTP